MKIVILCGSLHKGSCGIGDYSRTLAGELVRQGHQIGIVALNDKFLQIEEEGFQESDFTKITVLRLPSVMLSSQRFNRARTWIDNFDPEWLSFQFEPFSFNEKGLPYRLSSLIYSLGKSRRWQVMFHEVWLGMEREASAKMVLWGFAQQILIRNILRRLNPQIIHTQSQVHQYALTKINVNAQLLPLISNIPVSTSTICHTSQISKPKHIAFVIFGSIYYGAPIAEFASEVRSFAKENGVQFTIISIGRNRKLSEDWVAICKKNGINVTVLGEQTEERISEVFNRATFGISTTPFILSEKSGTVMAMLEHGLRVICVARPYNLRAKVAVKPLKGVTQYLKGNLKSCLCYANHVDKLRNRVSEISHQFIVSLSST